MNRRSARAVCLDASVLVKRYVSEPHSELVRAWIAEEPGAYTTDFCFYEALNIFKSKWKHQSKISGAEYTSACTSLIAWFGGISRAGFVNDPPLTTPEAWRWVTEVVSATGLDYSDAYQLYSMKHGYFKYLGDASRTVLVTTDGELAQVARRYDLLAIDLCTETKAT